MSITPIIFVLVILLFGFDSAGQIETRRETQLRLELMSDRMRVMRVRKGMEGGAGPSKGKDCLWCATNCR